MENTSPRRSIHVGHNIQRFRLMRGLSQSGLAHLLEKKRGKPVSQQIISDIEDRERVADEELLKQIAEVLEVSPEALQHLDWNAAVNIISNTFTHTNNDTATGNFNLYGNSTTFNPVDKIVELFERIIKERDNEIENLKKEIENSKRGKK